MELKVGDLAAQILGPPDPANSPHEFVVRVEVSRPKKAEGGRDHPGPAIERAPQHLADIARGRYVIPLTEELAECPLRGIRWCGCGNWKPGGDKG